MLRERVALLNTTYDNNYSVQQPRGYAPIVIYNDYCPGQEEVGCKGWGHLRSRHRRGKRVSRSFVKLSAFTFAAANHFTAEGKRFIVTHNRSATPGKLGTKAILLVPFDRRYRWHTVFDLTAACSSAQDLSPPLLLDPEAEINLL